MTAPLPRPARNKGFVIAGIVLGVVGLLVSLGIGAYLLVSSYMVHRDTSGSVTSGGAQYVSQLRRGDCITDIGTKTIHVVPCQEPHIAEVLGWVEIPESVSAGSEQLLAEQNCSHVLEDGVLAEYQGGRLTMLYLTAETGRGKQIACVARATGESLTGSIVESR